MMNNRGDTLILTGVNWKRVGSIVIRELCNRERHAPVISVYRWWARRPHALIGAILDAAVNLKKRNLAVSDPFSGGGTVAFEAIRRGLPVYAQDLYPWPTTGLVVSLSSVSPDELSKSASTLLESLEPLRSNYRRPDGRELTHILRVRVGVCPKCDRPVYLFPDPLVSLASRSKTERGAFYGCKTCGHLSLGSRDKIPSKCHFCSESFRTHDIHRGVFACPHCAYNARRREFENGEPNWKAIAVQESALVDGRHRGFPRPVEREDPVDSPPASKIIPELRRPVPEGVETHRLLDSGFQTWGDLYTDRQADVLLSALRRIDSMPASEACKDRLALAVIGIAEMPAFLSRWDRYHLKVFEGLANHRYADTTVVVEMNPLSSLGRGTLPHRLHSAKEALEWILKEAGPTIKTTRRRRMSRSTELKKGVTIATGCSSHQWLFNKTVDLVLTDPPYYDDVQYGELAHLFHFWLSLYRGDRMPDFNETEEAVPNRSRGHGLEFYVKSISACLKESKRTLVSGGKLILTFHNKKMVAWHALCCVLIRSGFALRAIAVVRAENKADHSKRNGKGMLYDLVLECERRKDCRGKRLIRFSGNSQTDKSLLAMGTALSKAVRRMNPDVLPELYQSELEKFGIKESCIL